MSLKRLPILIAFVAILALGVAACGGGETTTTVTAPAASTGAAQMARTPVRR